MKNARVQIVGRIPGELSRRSCRVWFGCGRTSGRIALSMMPMPSRLTRA